MSISNTTHLTKLLSYIGIGFVSGAVSHGFFSGTRSLVMALIGIILFLIAEYLQHGLKNYLNILVYGLIMSLCIGMVSGGLQHFLDSPARSLRIVPIGMLWSYAIILLEYCYPWTWRGRWVTIIITIAMKALLRLLLYILPLSRFMAGHH